MSIRRLSNAAVRDLYRFHASLLADRVRTESYRAAIESVVQPHHVVADLGCGTGILASFAARAGAKRVYAIDEGAVIAIARELAADNGLADRITFIESSSFDVTLDEPADVLITETMGNSGFDEGIALAVIDARRRWMRREAIVIPRAIEMIAVPIERACSESWPEETYGFDYARVARNLANVVEAVQLDRSTFVAEPQTIMRSELEEASLRGAAPFTIVRSATVNAIAVWFRATLTPAITISNEPPNQCPSWKQAVFPLREDVRVECGDFLAVEMQTFDGAEWRWRVLRDGELLSEQSTLENGGVILSRADGEGSGSL
jgi:predicted RNA methylase